MTVLTYVKLIAIAVALVLAVHFKGEIDKGVLERDHAAMAEGMAKALIARQTEHQAEMTRVNNLVRAYESQAIDPVVPGIAGRLYKYTLSQCSLPTPGPAAGGTRPPSGVSRGDPEAQRLSQAAFDAGARDAGRLELCKAAWPR